MNTVGQTVQQAVEQAKDAGQKGMVVFCWSTASRLKALIGPPALLLVPLLVGNKLQRCYSCLFSVLKALDEVYKVAETGEKAVKNVANQATAWGKSFGQ